MGINNHPSSALLELVKAHKTGQTPGMYSVCSANRLVLEACMKQAIQSDRPLLIESTSNQVNQEGGYTGMTPASFSGFVYEIASSLCFSPRNIILGGDHLGPNPWQAEPAQNAMSKACRMVKDYVSAGFCKIHLDASMRLADDDPSAPLSQESAARRSAELCHAAEETAAAMPGSERPVYIIGTEVPVPGGSQGREEAVNVTRVEDVIETIETTRHAFFSSGLHSAWERVVALVVQPGVEFGDDTLFAYQRTNAEPLSRLIEGYPDLVYEAHSTDYQTRQALRQMVEDHFAILKVGPGLSFAMREAVFALAMLEKEWLTVHPELTLSLLIETLESAMQADPRYWKKYYAGSEPQQALSRRYSYSDRIRYYWPYPRVAEALDRLLDNLTRTPPPLTLLSQYLPRQAAGVLEGRLDPNPRALIHAKIMEVTAKYSHACLPAESQ